MRYTLMIIAMTSILAFGGCGGTVGKKFDTSKVENIINGTTTQMEIKSIFGKPFKKINKSQLRALRKMPYFDNDAIRDCLMMGANYESKYYDTQLKEEDSNEEYGSDKYEVLEYWGIMDAEYLREAEIDVPEDIDDLDELQINAWICNGKLLRAVVNPFTPNRIRFGSTIFCVLLMVPKLYIGTLSSTICSLWAGINYGFAVVYHPITGLS